MIVVDVSSHNVVENVELFSVVCAQNGFVVLADVCACVLALFEEDFKAVCERVFVLCVFVCNVVKCLEEFVSLKPICSRI